MLSISKTACWAERSILALLSAYQDYLWWHLNWWHHRWYKEHDHSTPICGMLGGKAWKRVNEEVTFPSFGYLRVRKVQIMSDRNRASMETSYWCTSVVHRPTARKSGIFWDLKILESDWLIARAQSIQILPSRPRVRTALKSTALATFEAFCYIVK